MIAAERPVSEDDLHAYVDGFLAPDDRARVERYLGEHPDAGARVREWTLGRDALRRVLEPKAREPIPSALNVARLAQARSKRQWEPQRIAASLVFTLLVGAGAGWFAHGSDSPRGLAGLSEQAALSQRVYSTDAQLVSFTTNTEQQLGFVGQDMSRKIKAPDLSGAGYKLVGGHSVPTEQGAACMFVYENAAGARITLFSRLMVGVDMNAPMRPVEMQDAKGFAWSHDGVGFSLISGQSDAALHDLSNKVRDTMDART